ncbi:hypothetical protein JST56_04920 [Candidatus Dependentiae bacterium]|nr:hypothetical protein [Candidatus Dependentiae bacterium]
MDNTREQGFIVRRFLPHKQKISVITNTMGKISLVIKNPIVCSRFWPGMLINFALSEKNNTFHLAQELEIIDLFAYSSPDDTQWTQQLLELCYFFVPANSMCDDIYHFLSQCLWLARQKDRFSSLPEELYLMSFIRFFILVGFYPADHILQLGILFENFLTSSIDFNDPQNIKSVKEYLYALHEKSIQDAHLWIADCIKSHPNFASFKTMDILR